APQDVLEFRRETAKESGAPGYYEYTLGSGAEAGAEIKARLLPRLQAKKGDRVYRIKNAALLKNVEERYVSREKRIPVKGIFYAKAGEVCTLEVSAPCKGLLFAVPFPKQEATTVTVRLEGFLCEKAGKLPATEASVRKQLEKTGNEAFFFENLTISLADDVFLPNGLLNELRRKALSALADAMNARYRRAEAGERSGEALAGTQRSDAAREDDETKESKKAKTVEKARNNKPYTDCLVSTGEQAEAAAGEEAVRRIYLDIAGENTERLCDLARKFRLRGKEIWLCFPRICRKSTLERIEAEFEVLRQNFDGYLLRNYETLSLVMRLDAEWHSRCALDYNMYVMNREAKAFYRALFGERDCVTAAPQELSAKELRELEIEDMTMVVYGRIPLMVSAHCVRKTMGLCRGKETKEPEPVVLTDRVGKKLLIKQNCKDCYNIIYNPECLSLLDREEEIKLLCPAALRLDFTFESKEETLRVLKSAAGNRLPVTGAGYTRGHFKRGVE
ncbi:MAG: DUF3656 domain-containing protein, partial [Lachnospiraceae bacterium]